MLNLTPVEPIVIQLAPSGAAALSTMMDAKLTEAEARLHRASIAAEDALLTARTSPSLEAQEAFCQADSEVQEARKDVAEGRALAAAAARRKDVTHDQARADERAALVRKVEETLAERDGHVARLADLLSQAVDAYNAATAAGEAVASMNVFPLPVAKAGRLWSIKTAVADELFRLSATVTSNGMKVDAFPGAAVSDGRLVGNPAGVTPLVTQIERASKYLLSALNSKSV